MNTRTLATALAISVGLNLFGLGAAGAFWLNQSRQADQGQSDRQPPRERGVAALTSDLPEDVRTNVRQQLRASALAARPDFETARTQRRAAVTAAQAETFEPDQIRALLKESREAEMRGRARLETDAVTMLGELNPQDRQVMSRILVRRGGSGHGGPGRGGRRGAVERGQAEPAATPPEG